MKKKYVIVLLIIMFGLGISVDKLLFSNNETLEDKVDVPKTPHKDMLSMMLETESGSGEYNLETRSSWPTKEDGYIFNSTLSKCENGSKLSWDEENNAVLMEASMSDKCYVYFDVYVPPVNLTDYIKSLYTGTQGENGIYYHNGTILGEDGTIMDAEDNSYRYAGGNYGLTDLALNNNYKYINTYNNLIDVDNVLISPYCNGEKSWSCFSTSYSFILSYNDMKFDTLDQAREQAISDGYLKRDNVKNYVCFGSDANICPEDNLYRIIGVFNDKVKVIKSSIASSKLLGTDGDYSSDNKYYWNKINYTLSYNSSGCYDDWNYSALNNINLNLNFINNFSAEWIDKIFINTWKNNRTYNGLFTNAKTSYTNEMVEVNDTNYISNGKIGLMYLSDYYYGALPRFWSYKGRPSPYNNEVNANSYSYYLAQDDNWLSGNKEWTITRGSDGYIYFVDGSSTYCGNLNDSSENVNDYPINVRPVFYLQSNVNKISGDGTEDSPYRLS